MLYESLPIIFALLVTGVVAGILAGLLGVGGGIVIVPVLYFIFQLLGISPASAMSIATGTSLLIILATSISSINAHYRRQNVDMEIAKLWGPFLFIGVIIGALTAVRAGGTVAMGIFGVVAILVAANMRFRAGKPALFQKLPGRFFQSLLASIVGLISVIMGIGGGTLGVPILTACNTPAHRAVGTAATFGLVIALPGAALMFLFSATPADAPVGTYGFINLPGFALIAPLSVLLAPLGVRLGASLDSTKLKQIFALFLFISGSRMMYQSFIN